MSPYMWRAIQLMAITQLHSRNFIPTNFNYNCIYLKSNSKQEKGDTFKDPDYHYNTYQNNECSQKTCGGVHQKDQRGSPSSSPSSLTETMAIKSIKYENKSYWLSPW